MIAAYDSELMDWLYGLVNHRPVRPGGFLLAVAEAAVHADPENYIILRPALVQLRDKYPKYSYKGSPDE